MMRRLLLACLLLAVGPSPGPAQIPLATDSPRPLPPAESLKRFQLDPGFRIELVAAEPLVADPVAMAFDAQGRIFVCEIHGYNLEGYLDALDGLGKLTAPICGRRSVERLRRLHADRHCADSHGRAGPVRQD